MKKVRLIIHNIRSAHNVGSLLRTAEGLGVEKVYITGYSPYPLKVNDERLPHIAKKVHNQIQKTALDTESYIEWEQHDDVISVINILKTEGFTIVALEQTKSAIPLSKFASETPIALLPGSEVTGVDTTLLKKCDLHIEIPMFGKKESFNVAQAAAIALYHLTLSS